MLSPTEINRRAGKIKMILLDVDGVMTDGRVHLDANLVESKAFFVRDGFGILLGRKAGLEFAIITGLLSPIVEKRAQVLGIKEVHYGFIDKAEVLADILSRRQLSPSEAAYMGDDLFDLSVMRLVGLTGAPRDAHPEVRAEAHWVSQYDGGRGAVREFIELVVKARGQWEQMLGEFVK